MVKLWKAIQGKERLTGRHMLLLAGLIVFVLLAAGGSVAYTSRSEFCATCHEMTPMAQSWQTSAHKNVACEDCHSEPGVKGVVKAKAKGMQELYLHVIGSQIIPRANDRDINCFSCHQDKVKMDTDRALAAKDPHTVKHFSNGMTCITCHSGIVHNEKLNNTLPSRDTCSNCHLDTMKK